MGPVSKKYSEAIWKRFISACDYFFEQKAKATSSQRNVELENLEKKKAILEQLNEINKEENTSEESGDIIRKLMKEWNTIGHIPFKDKDKLYKQYRKVIDELFDKLNLTTSQKKLSNFKSSISNKDGNLYREREKLMRAFENMKAEIKTYENNIGFFAGSKNAESLVAEVRVKIAKAKADMAEAIKKVQAIDAEEEKQA